MTNMHFKLHKNGYTCQTCKLTFSVYGFQDYGYGQFILYNRSEDMIYWSLPEDHDSFYEARELLTPMLSTVTLNLPIGAQPIQWIMGVCCDRIGDNSMFRINPYCHSCSSHQTKFAGPNVPYESKEFDIVVATHNTWESLNEIEKQELVRAALSDLT